MVDIPAATIRNWEERYATIVPSAARADIASTPATRSSSSASSRGGRPRALGRRRPPTARRAPQPATPRPRRRRALVRDRSSCSPSAIPYVGGARTSSSCAREGYEVVLAFAVGEAEEHWRSSPAGARDRRPDDLGGPGRAAVRAPEARRFGRRARHLRPAGARTTRWPPAPTPSSQKPLDPLDLVSTVKDLLGRAPWSLRRARRDADERSASRAATTGLDADPRRAVCRATASTSSSGCRARARRSSCSSTCSPARRLNARRCTSPPSRSRSRRSSATRQTLELLLSRRRSGASVFYEDLGHPVTGESGLDAVSERIARTDPERGRASSSSTASRRWPRTPTTRGTSAASCTSWRAASGLPGDHASGSASTASDAIARWRPSSRSPTGSSRSRRSA